MKLLFDQNISFRIVQYFQKAFPISEQVRRLNLEDISDRTIWTFARDNDFTIVTFDADFYEFSILYGHPPKIIWLRIGNNTTFSISKTLSSKEKIIKDFITQEEFSCLEVH